MRLELGNFPVEDVVFGSETAWKDGVLELDEGRLLAPILAEPSVRDAGLEIARPGESARIINHFDILEPKVKVSGQGTVYPGRAGRPVETVGQGRTHRLGGMTLVVSYDGAYDRWGSNAPAGYLTSPHAPKWFETHGLVEMPREDRRQVWSNHHFIDMSGPGAVLPFASTTNLCLSMSLDDGLDIQNKASVSNAVGLKLQDTLAETVRDLEPPEIEVFDMGVKDPSLPGMVFVWMLSSPEGSHGPQSVHGAGVYGHTRLSAPWLLWPTEVMDGAITGGGRGHGSWALSNNPIVMGLSRRHGKSLNFLSCIVLREPWYSEVEMQFVGYRAAEGCQAARRLRSHRHQRGEGAPVRLLGPHHRGHRRGGHKDRLGQRGGGQRKRQRSALPVPPSRHGGRRKHRDRRRRPVPSRRARARKLPGSPPGVVR